MPNAGATARHVLAAVLALLVAGCGNAYYQGPVTDHFDGEDFHSLGRTQERSLLGFLEWRLTREPPRWPEHVAVERTVPERRITGDRLRVTRVGMRRC